MITKNVELYHDLYGIGKVDSIEGKYITVNFPVGLKKFAYPDSIGTYLFELLSSSFVIKNYELVKYIGQRKNIVIPQNIQIIGEKAFKGSSVEYVSLDNHVKKIDDEAFSECKSLMIVAGLDGVISIGKKAFKNCISLSEIVLPESLLNFEGAVFAGCESLERINIPSKIKKLDHEIFQDCSELKEVTGNINTEVIDNDVFLNCINLRNIDLGNKLIKIGKRAFRNCVNLDSVKLPPSAASIADDAFDETIIIYGNKGSYIEKYATSNKLIFHSPSDYRIDYTDSDQNYSYRKTRSNDNLTRSPSPNEIVTVVPNNVKRRNKLNFRRVLSAVFGIACTLFAFTARYAIGNIIENFRYGYIVEPEGIYRGNSFLGVIDGPGTMELYDGNLYSGDWKRGIPEGKGTLTLSDGSVFEGEFVEGELNEGTYKVSDNLYDIEYHITDSEVSSYLCSLSDGTTILRNLTGEGAEYVINYSNGDKYEGDLKRGLRNGDGYYRWNDGTEYRGSWLLDQIDGAGTLELSSGIQYRGVFQDNAFVSGDIDYKKGSYEYVFSVSDGIISDEVTINNSFNDSYNGTVYSETKKGTGTIKYKNGGKYEGEILNGKKEGYGEYQWPDGKRYVGYWKNDKMNGQGTYYYGTTQRLTGSFVDNEPNGTCYYYTSSGTKYVVTYKNGIQKSIY